MEILFEKNIPDNIKDVVVNLLNNDRITNGNITIDHIPGDVICDYDLPEEFSPYEDEIYSVSQCVCGTWDQPIGMVAIRS